MGTIGLKPDAELAVLSVSSVCAVPPSARLCTYSKVIVGSVVIDELCFARRWICPSINGSLLLGACSTHMIE